MCMHSMQHTHNTSGNRNAKEVQSARWGVGQSAKRSLMAAFATSDEDCVTSLVV